MSRAPAARGVISPSTAASVPTSTLRVETTLSFAIKPVIYRPDSRNFAVYRKEYAVYRELYERNKDLMRISSEIAMDI